MWIGTHLGGLNKLDLHTNRFIRLPDESGRPGTLPSDIVRDIVPYGDKLIIATQNGVCLFNPATGTCEHLFKDTKEGRNIGMVASLYIDKDETLWVSATGRGRIFLPLRHWQAHPLCTQSLHSEHSQQQQCQQHHAGQQRQPVVLHFRKRARPLPQGEQRLRKLRYAERRPIQRLYLRSIRVVPYKRETCC